MKPICLKCKGNNPQLCGRNFCPILMKSQSFYKVKERVIDEHFLGSSPAPFIGRFNYPNINVGILSPAEITEEAWKYDAPKYWSSYNYKIPELVELRSSLINSRFTTNIKKQSKFLEISQEVGMASKPADLEFNLKDKPIIRLSTNPYSPPTGPVARLIKVKLTSNPKIHTKVDKVTSDFDLKAKDAITYLYEQGFDENFLTKILSVGVLGLKKNRKLVPTRWSITATDDTLGKNIIEEIKDYNQVNYLSYFNGYLGNYYLILFFPNVWSYELFEMYAPKTSWNISNKIEFMTDYESHYGRKHYADNTSGGYYAARLPILEKLKELRKQGAVLALRFITWEYNVELGVWVCREATRKSLNSKPIQFEDKELMLKYAKVLIKKKFGVDLNIILKQSRLLKDLMQPKLTDYIK